LGGPFDPGSSSFNLTAFLLSYGIDSIGPGDTGWTSDWLPAGLGGMGGYAHLIPVAKEL
jgi:hypothetical protein